MGAQPAPQAKGPERNPKSRLSIRPGFQRFFDFDNNSLWDELSIPKRSCMSRRNDLVIIFSMIAIRNLVSADEYSPWRLQEVLNEVNVEFVGVLLDPQEP